jgi:hypothetical protein
VDCAGCGLENLAGAHFCGECGASLATVASCPGCGAENPGAHKFCSACGGSLNAPPSASGGGAETPAANGSSLAAARARRTHATTCAAGC